jgi:hypothetical protein
MPKCGDPRATATNSVPLIAGAKRPGRNQARAAFAIVSGTGMTGRTKEERIMNKRYWLGVLAYLVPSFPLAYVWHLIAFKPWYDALAVYRADMIVPFGFASMVIQALAFSWAYPKLFPDRGAAFLGNGLRYGLGLAALAGTYTVLSVAAKHVMNSVADFVMIEAAFTLVQFLITGPLIAWAWRNPD